MTCSLIEEAGEDVKRFFPLWAQAVHFAIETGRYAIAEEALREPPATNTIDHAQAHALSGELAEAKRKFAEAAVHYRKALALNPRGHANFEIARVSLMLLDIEAAQEHMKYSLENSRTTYLLRGQPVRVSQTHLGQLLDEFTLDKPLLSRLKKITLDEPNRQVAELRALVAANPDHTLSSIRLLLALRRRGDLRDRLSSRPRRTNVRQYSQTHRAVLGCLPRATRRRRTHALLDRL